MKNIKLFSHGEDVRKVKDKLVELGFLAKSTHNTFGYDSVKALKAFQGMNGIEQDGICGEITWGMLFDTAEPKESPVFEIPEHIGVEARKSISTSLASVSEERRKLCLAALEFAVDPSVKNSSMRCFYIRGGNLYDKDLSLHAMSNYRLNKYFNTKAYAPYYDGGREEVMRTMAKDAEYKIPGCDCSGFIVGLWRKYRVRDAGFDASANTLYKSHCVETKNPQPGDLAWRDGHIGLIVGDYVCESVGGAYGVQLTKIKSRKVFNFVTGKTQTMSKWTAFGDPKHY